MGVLAIAKTLGGRQSKNSGFTTVLTSEWALMSGPIESASAALPQTLDTHFTLRTCFMFASKIRIHVVCASRNTCDLFCLV